MNFYNLRLETLEEARESAKALSLKNWDTYFHIRRGADKLYQLTKWKEHNSLEYYLKGEHFTHV